MASNWKSKTDSLPSYLQKQLATLRGHVGEDGYEVLADLVVWAQVWQDAVNGEQRNDDAAISVAMLPFFGSFGMPDLWTVLRPQLTPLVMQIAVNWTVARQNKAEFNLPDIVLHQLSTQIATVLYGVTNGVEVTTLIDQIHSDRGVH
jgi:hypothetical protein